MIDRYTQAAMALQRAMVTRHWDGQALVGPDPGPRFSYRIGRFIKSYLPQIAWRDHYYYLQAQGYWALGNWRLFDRSACEGYRAIAMRCAEQMLAQQHADGSWVYPHPEWKGRIANFEGTWGSLGLLETYRRTGEARFLEGALSWHSFQSSAIGFQRIGDELAPNYFAHRIDERVPNTATLVLRFLAELAQATGDTTYLQSAPGLLRFIQNAQKTNGELPYTLPGTHGGPNRPHFQCYQYNAFQCLNLIRFYELTANSVAREIVEQLVEFLRCGLAADGHVFYDCRNRYRAVTYHAAAFGAALSAAQQIGIDGCAALAERAYAYVLALQQPDGGFRYSSGDYRLLSDQRSYPRYLAMILYHLLQPALRDSAPTLGWSQPATAINDHFDPGSLASGTLQ